MKLTWLGHAAVLIEGSVNILIDPFLSGNPSAGLTKDKLPSIDIVAITHDHEDHLGDAFEIAKEHGSTVVAIHEIAVAAQEKGLQAEGTNIGGEIEVKGAKIRIVPALHSSYRGSPVGFLIELDGKRIYHAGDTGLTMEMQVIGMLYPPDVSFLPIGSRYTMDVLQAAKAVEFTKTKKVVPIHYNTWPPIQADPEKLKELVGDKAEVVILKPGESLQI